LQKWDKLLDKPPILGVDSLKSADFGVNMGRKTTSFSTISEIDLFAVNSASFPEDTSIHSPEPSYTVIVFLPLALH
jgi:hypothetical protein